MSEDEDRIETLEDAIAEIQKLHSRVNNLSLALLSTDTALSHTISMVLALDLKDFDDAKKQLDGIYAEQRDMHKYIREVLKNG